MTNFEKRHINCFETLVGVVLGLVIYSIAMAAGIGLTLIPLDTKFFLAMGVIVLIFSNGGFILHMILIAKEYSKTRDKLMSEVTKEEE